MHLLIFLSLLLVFLFINGKIIFSDLKYKKIPNKYLLYLWVLLPIFYIYLLIINNIHIEILIFLVQIIASIFLSFLLYYNGIWSAGDAKYLLILSLYLPNIGIIPFIGNLALVTVIYLLGYYMYFYGKFFFRWTLYRNSFYMNILTDQKDRFKTFLHNHTIQRTEVKRAVYNILKFIITFFTFFISIRLIRSYLVGDLISMEIMQTYIIKYPTYYIFIIWGILFLTFIILKKLFSKFKIILDKKIIGYGYAIDLDFNFSLLLFLLLTSFIFYEYVINPKEITHKLFLIFTLYLAIFLIFKVLFYSYKIVFHLNEQDTISIDLLKEGDIVDKEYLITLFWSQDSLGYCSWSNKNEGLFSPSPKDYLQNMENPIDATNVMILKKAFNIVNTYHEKNKTPNFQKVWKIRVLKTFPFWIYIFLGFLITFIWWELPSQIIMQNFLKIFHLLH